MFDCVKIICLSNETMRAHLFSKVCGQCLFFDIDT